MRSRLVSVFTDALATAQVPALDVASRYSELGDALLPAINCSSGNMLSDTARRFADKKTQIAYSYLAASHLSTQMYSGCDRFVTYGFMPFIIEADDEKKMPVIRIDDPFGAYPEYDRFGNLIAYMRRYEKTVGELVNLYPEHESLIRFNKMGGRHGDNSKIELIRWQDKNATYLYLPTQNGLLLWQEDNPLSRIPVVAPKRPGLDEDQIKGEFDDVLWPWLARARFALLALEGA